MTYTKNLVPDKKKIDARSLKKRATHNLTMVSLLSFQICTPDICPVHKFFLLRFTFVLLFYYPVYIFGVYPKFLFEEKSKAEQKLQGNKSINIFVTPMLKKFFEDYQRSFFEKTFGRARQNPAKKKTSQVQK